jgi:outer membrane protein assembly factor BamA
MMTRLICFLLAYLLGISALQAQDNSYFKYLRKKAPDSSKPRMIAYPTLAFAPETSWEIGVASLFLFHAKNDTLNRLSEVYGFSFITMEDQYGIWFDHALYTNENKWFFLGRLRVQSFPLKYHGIGNDTPAEYLAIVDANQFIFKERVLYKIKENFYSGLEVDFQNMSNVEFITKGKEIIDMPLGHEGYRSVGLGYGLIYDSRHNVLNVRDGFFSELAMLNYNRAWGSTYNFTSVISDTRIFKPVNKRDVFAAQLFGQFNFGDVPFNQLGLLGGESLMRGYYYGRYRDKNYLASQIEYRFLPLPLGFTKRLGASVFCSSGTVFNSFENFTFRNMPWGAGGGLRFLLFPKKDIYTRLDYAFTREGGGFYIFIGEAF